MIDRKINAGLILAIALQTATALIWAGAAAERIDTLERDVQATRPVSERLARLEAQLEAISGQLTRIEARVERL